MRQSGRISGSSGATSRLAKAGAPRKLMLVSPRTLPRIGTKVPRQQPARPATIGFVKSSTALKLIGEFLGFLLVSTGGTLVCIGVLLVLSRIALGDGDAGSVVRWVNLVLGSGVSGISMLAAGICLVRWLKA